ncbi:hypothetical protein ACHAQH_009056 [Verticillium albo-atrum]
MLPLPRLVRGTTQLQNAIPKVDSEALRFSATYSKASDNDNLLRRRRALLLLGNVERLVDVLELPALLSSAIAAVPPNYAMALDINSHIRRLHLLYPESPLIASVFRQASEAIDRLTADLVNTLKIPSLKLAAALRTVSWLRRVLPGFDTESGIGRESQERALSLLFLRCRLATLATTLDALQPLQELANEEKARQTSSRNAQSWSGGQQTERFLKRYVEIFREQSFSIVSMFNSIFGLSAAASGEPGNDPLQPLPSVLSSFPLYLVEKLLETLHEYLPAVKDQAARDSILTQVLYCSGSMGRLGGDFGMLLPGIRTGYVQTAPEDSGNVEWVDIVKRHRLLAGRLDSIIGDYKGTAIKGT